MACGLNITSISLRPTDFSTVNANHPKSTAFLRRKFPFATTSPESSIATPNGPPQIELEFVAPKPGGDGEYPVDRATATSGEKLLRNIMLDNKLELYGTYGKVMNCGGGGSCGTCIVEIIDGKDLLNERTSTELKYLKKKPESWRLACQTIVGNKVNSGKVLLTLINQGDRRITDTCNSTKIASMEKVTLGIGLDHILLTELDSDS